MSLLINFYKKYTSLISKHPVLLLSMLFAFNGFLLYSGILSRSMLVMLVLIMIPLSFFLALTLNDILFPNKDDDDPTPTLSALKKPSSLTSGLLSVVIVVIGTAFFVSGDTDIPPTHISIFKLNHPISEVDVKEAGLHKLEGYSRKGISVFKDATNPAVEYIVKTDEDDLIYKITAEIKLESEDLADIFYEETSELWDAKFGGGNQGFDSRFHRDTKLRLSRWSSKTVRIYLIDRAAEDAIDDKYKAIQKEKEMLAFN